MGAGRGRARGFAGAVRSGGADLFAAQRRPAHPTRTLWGGTGLWGFRRSAGPVGGPGLGKKTGLVSGGRWIGEGMSRRSSRGKAALPTGRCEAGLAATEKSPAMRVHRGAEVYERPREEERGLEPNWCAAAPGRRRGAAAYAWLQGGGEEPCNLWPVGGRYLVATVPGRRRGTVADVGNPREEERGPACRGRQSLAREKPGFRARRHQGGGEVPPLMLGPREEERDPAFDEFTGKRRNPL